MKALYEQDLFPRTIAGSSVGSLMAAVTCGHKYSDIWKMFDKDYGAITAHVLHWKFKDYFEAI